LKIVIRIARFLVLLYFQRLCIVLSLPICIIFISLPFSPFLRRFEKYCLNCSNGNFVSSRETLAIYNSYYSHESMSHVRTHTSPCTILAVEVGRQKVNGCIRVYIGLSIFELKIRLKQYLSFKDNRSTKL